MVKKSKTTHAHKRRVRYPARLSATLGYVFFALSWLLVIGAAGGVVIEFIAATFSLYPNESVTPIFLYSPLTDVTTAEPNVLLEYGIKAAMVALFVAALALSSHFIAVHMSMLVRWCITRLGLKVTERYIFIMKAVLAICAPLIMLIVILGLPVAIQDAQYFLTGVCILLSLASIVCFFVQHMIARHSNMAVGRVL